MTPLLALAIFIVVLLFPVRWLHRLWPHEHPYGLADKRTLSLARCSQCEVITVHRKIRRWPFLPYSLVCLECGREA